MEKAERPRVVTPRVRRKRRTVIGQRLLQLLPAPFSLAAEVALLVLLVDRSIDVRLWLLLHSVHALVLMLWAKWLGSRVRRNQVAWFLAVGTAAMGPIGPATAIATGVLLVVFHRDWFDFQAWYSSLFPTATRTRVNELYEFLVRRRSVQRGGVESFADILSGDDATRKRIAIALLTRHFRPGFAPALKLALIDADASVRTQAATAVATLEGRFLANAQILTRKLGARPQSFARRLALAQHYDDYAFTGLLDPERERDNRLKALAGYQAALEVRPRDRRSWLAIGRILVREHRYAAAAEWFDTAVERDLLSADLVLWQLEVLFRLGRYGRVREVLGKHQHLFAEPGKRPPQLPEVLRLWAGTEARPS